MLPVALIGDLVASRDLQDRGQVQRSLAGLLEDLNREAQDGTLAAPLRITAGDEIQALLWRPAYAMPIVQRLTDGLLPVRLVFGLGRGELSTPTGLAPPRRAPDVAELDGPCFHRAREALALAKRGETWAVWRGFGEALDGILDAIFDLMGVIRAGWTAKQARTTGAVRGRPQKDVARQFSVSPSVVSESLKAARFEAILRSEEAVRRLLAGFGDEEESGS
jgi:hypothetical protein